MSSISPNTARLIAVVDDDWDVRAALGDLLRSEGYSPRLFETADGFLATFTAGHVACVISDVQMPGTNGLQLARLMQSQEVPVILITAFITPAVRQQAEAAGVQKLFGKPFDVEELVAELGDLLG